jgi:HSP20 family molecular chaperone IbpA
VEKPTIHVTVATKAPDAGPPDPARERMVQAFTPSIDIHEHPDGLILEADLPGAVEQNLRIQLEDNVLSLYARIDPPVPEGARLLHEEYRLGDYQRSFILGDEVDRERITAELTHGVLRLFLPKADRLRTRRIEIKS